MIKISDDRSHLYTFDFYRTTIQNIINIKKKF